jgi:Arc/MetJ-type ribon-helix-helix transcriptional regulator
VKWLGAALRTLERDEREYEAKLAAVQAAIDEGDGSGVARGDVFARVRKSLDVPGERL